MGPNKTRGVQRSDWPSTDRCGGMDRDLVVRAQQGDQRAFEMLATADYPRLFRVAHGVLGDRALAEDATQQALIDIWRKVRRLRDPAKYSGWSYRLLVRVCYAEAKRQPEWTSNDDLSIADEPRADDAYRSIADRDQVERAFRNLSMDHRVVLTLRYLLGMTPDEVAEVLDLPRQTVYSRLQAATKSMRAVLDADARRVTPAPVQQEARP
jgi:RNA polymerase sigma-70 factor (ECF subfamily)